MKDRNTITATRRKKPRRKKLRLEVMQKDGTITVAGATAVRLARLAKRSGVSKKMAGYTILRKLAPLIHSSRDAGGERNAWKPMLQRAIGMVDMGIAVLARQREGGTDA